MTQSRLSQLDLMKSITIVAVTILIGIMAPIMVIAITVMGAGIIIEIKGIFHKVQLLIPLGVVAISSAKKSPQTKAHNAQ